MLKILPAKAGDVSSVLNWLGTVLNFPGWEDPVEEEIITHASIIGWKIPLTEQPGAL